MNATVVHSHGNQDRPLPTNAREIPLARTRLCDEAPTSSVFDALGRSQESVRRIRDRAWACNPRTNAAVR